jgi:hypothetical protein
MLQLKNALAYFDKSLTTTTTKRLMRSSPEEEVVPGQEVDGEVRLAKDDVDLVGKITSQDLHPGVMTLNSKGGREGGRLFVYQLNNAKQN